MSDAGERHDKRAQGSADALRAMLTALATAGVAASYVVRDVQTRDYWRGSAALFALALVCVLASWFLVKHRELRRRNAARLGLPLPTFSHWFRSWTWDLAGFGFIVAGALFLALGFDW